MSLARNYINVGMKDKGKSYLKKIIEMHPDTKWAREAREMLKRP